jgi:hypothetical protein
MKKIKKNPLNKKDEIVSLYKSGGFYGTISIKDFKKNERFNIKNLVLDFKKNL